MGKASGKAQRDLAFQLTQINASAIFLRDRFAILRAIHLGQTMSTVAKIGFWSSLISFAAATGYGVVQVMQIAGILVFPVDEILIFGFSIVIPLPFVVALVALFHAVPEEKRIWPHAAILFGVIYAVLVTIVYGTQLGLVVPMRISGLSGSVDFLRVTNGTFMWVIDGAGYILMGLATLFAAGTFMGNPAQRGLKWFLFANGLIDPLIVAVYIYPSLLPFGSLWLITAPGSLLLLARYFKTTPAVNGF